MSQTITERCAPSSGYATPHNPHCLRTRSRWAHTI